MSDAELARGFGGALYQKPELIPERVLADLGLNICNSPNGLTIDGDESLSALHPGLRQLTLRPGSLEDEAVWR